MKIVSTLNVVNLTEDPSLTSDTNLYFNTASNVYRYYNSGSWVNLLDSSQLVVNTRSNVFEVGTLASASFTHMLSSDYINGVVIGVSEYDSQFIAPSYSTDPVSIGSSIKVIRGGSGDIEVIADGDTNLNIPSSIYLTTQWKTVTLIKTASNSWVVDGEFPDIY